MIVETLARRASEIPVPDAALRAATRRAFVDWLGVTLGGSDGLPARALRAGLDVGGGTSRLLGTPGIAPVHVAALINGTAAHTLELDDIYAPGLFHPGAPVIAAALAVADQMDATAGELWRALVVGFEIGCRVAADLGPTHYRHWHTTGTAGAVGAAAAAASLHRLDQVTFGHALSLAATMAGGLQQTFRSDAAGKPLHSGNAAQAGVVAVAAAAGGVTGASDVLEGDAGLAAATGATTDWAVSAAPLARPFAIEQVTVKPYACCGHAFSPIDGALELRAQGVRNVDRLIVATYATATTVAGIREPRTAAERRFSIPYLVAVALLQGRGALDDLENGVEGQAVEVTLEVDEDIDDRFPAHRGARVTAVLPDGERRSIDVPDRSGSPDRPLTDEQLRAKFLSTSALGARGPQMLASISGFPDELPVRALPLA
ncbi:MmgE/PrpD family protein [Cryptosporangium sp. NPDC051539]|uniref:MmgE/PrpD family protein n=1 Tax=Cryptosporangium sp. NPDC051539 TaxID=3363962 RepID=UPI00379BDB1E